MNATRTARRVDLRLLRCPDRFRMRQKKELTLGEAPFGTVRAGNRADLILTTENPRAAIENLRRPLAVIARGRLWSQEFLQAELDLLAARYDFGKTADDPLITDFDPGLPFCANHLEP